MAVLGIAATLVGCGQIQPPHGATEIHFRLLSQHAGTQRGIFAATNADDLLAQEVRSGPQPVATCTTKDQSGCIAPFSAPADSLLVAMQPMACADNHLDTGYLKGGTLTFVVNWTNTCPRGAGTVAVPEDWVVAVPLHTLPQTMLRLELDFSNGGNAPEIMDTGLVDLRAPGPGHVRAGNFSLDAAPRVVRGQAEHITLTIFKFQPLLQYDPWLIDIAAVDSAGAVAWHQAPTDLTPLNCLPGRALACAVGSLNVDVPTQGLSPGVYLIRPSFVLPTGRVEPPRPTPTPPPFALPFVTVEVTA